MMAYFSDIIRSPFTYFRETDYTRKSTPVAGIIITVLFSILCVGKVFLMIQARNTIDVKLSSTELLLEALLFLLSAQTEEFLFISLLYDSLREMKIPTIFSICIVCVVFAIGHVQFGFFELSGFFLIRLLILISYRFYRNIYLYIVYHFIHNASFLIAWA